MTKTVNNRLWKDVSKSRIRLDRPHQNNSHACLLRKEFTASTEMERWEKWEELITLRTRDLLESEQDTTLTSTLQSLDEVMNSLYMASCRYSPSDNGDFIASCMKHMHVKWRKVEAWFSNERFDTSQIAIRDLEEFKNAVENLVYKMSKDTEERMSLEPDHPAEPNSSSRCSRWTKLNRAIQKHCRRSRTRSTAFSDVECNQGFEEIFASDEYSQSGASLPEPIAELITTYSFYLRNLFPPLDSANESQILHLMLPVIILACVPIEDVRITAEANLVGEVVCAHGRFELTIRRGSKIKTIVNATVRNMAHGIPQNLIGCEVASETHCVDVMNGIVSDYTRWRFLRSMNDRILMCSHTLKVEDPESIVETAGMIYASLLED